MLFLKQLGSKGFLKPSFEWLNFILIEPVRVLHWKNLIEKFQQFRPLKPEIGSLEGFQNYRTLQKEHLYRHRF